MKLIYGLIFLIPGISIALIFWSLAGHDLTYNIGSGTRDGYTFSHSEDFSLSGRIMITAFLGFIGGVAATLFIYALHKLLQFSSRAKNEKTA